MPTVDTATKPTRKQRRLSELEKIVAKDLLVVRRAPASLVAACFGISALTARRLRDQADDEVAA